MRRFLMVLAAISAVIAGGWLFTQRRRGGTLSGHEAVQWPFDPTELRSLMANVVAEQRERIASIDDSAGRDRAQAFLDYYERRRQAAAS
jgi:regulator of sirC expression with transglutaminase-like and TPR domain